MEVASSTTSVSPPSASPELVPGPCDAKIEGITHATSDPLPSPPPPSAPPKQECDLHASKKRETCHPPTTYTKFRTSNPNLR